MWGCWTWWVTLVIPAIQEEVQCCPGKSSRPYLEQEKKKIKKDWGVTQMVEHFPASMRPVLSNDEESFKIFKELLL
jgi:hypothetical protein